MKSAIDLSRPFARNLARNVYERTSFALAWATILGIHATFANAETPTAKPDHAVVEEISGQTVQGPLTEFGPDHLTIAANPPLRIARTDILKLSFPARKTTTSPRAAIVILENGDRLAMESGAIDGESFVGQLEPAGQIVPVKIPLETIRAILISNSGIPSERRLHLRELQQGRETSDVVRLINGDRVAGELKSLDGGKLTVTTAGSDTSIDRGNVRSIRFNSELVSFPETSESRTLVTLTDRSRLTAVRLELRPQHRLFLRAAFGGEFEIPFASVTALQVLGGRVHYLSDLKPAEYQFVPFLTRMWPLQIDRNVNGDPLSIDNIEYAKGLGVHSSSRVRYALDGEFRQFRALAGIDDSTEGQGSVKFAVEVDGRRVFTSDECRGKDPAIRVGPIDLAGTKELTLIVEFGQRGDILDHANWADALLVK
ncbi:MAG: NPCBM/NEW2 domain-containing protein [Planctomycetaceae bacterium]